MASDVASINGLSSFANECGKCGGFFVDSFAYSTCRTPISFTLFTLLRFITIELNPAGSALNCITAFT